MLGSVTVYHFVLVVCSVLTDSRHCWSRYVPKALIPEGELLLSERSEHPCYSHMHRLKTAHNLTGFSGKILHSIKLWEQHYSHRVQGMKWSRMMLCGCSFTEDLLCIAASEPLTQVSTWVSDNVPAFSLSTCFFIQEHTDPHFWWSDFSIFCYPHEVVYSSLWMLFFIYLQCPVRETCVFSK